ncbi:MAG: ADP-ribosylglycohydrolase family protein [Planctomycetota bacterium]
MNRQDHILGCILGTAVGDAIGLPREGLSARRAERIFGGPPLDHRFFFGRGVCSDDTEHTVMLGLAFLASEGEPKRFAAEFARRLRWWFARIPAGIGLGTAKACLKLWLGARPDRSGVNSAGNGPAMRSAILGLIARDEQHATQLVQTSTAVTHKDPRAHQGAIVIANLARWVTLPESERQTVDAVIFEGVGDEQLRENLTHALNDANKDVAPDDFAKQLGQAKGISGFVNHTVPAAVYCWLRHRGSFRDTVETAVCLGGDSDTVAAIAGALAGTELGVEAIPEDWLSNLKDWPCSVQWMQQLAEALAAQNASQSTAPPSYSGTNALIRNVLFTAIVLLHGFRRLLPPY